MTADKLFSTFDPMAEYVYNNFQRRFDNQLAGAL